MAICEPIHRDDILEALTPVSAPLGWQIDGLELTNRLDDAADAVFRILNAPYYESDLSGRERHEAERAYEQAMENL